MPLFIPEKPDVIQERPVAEPASETPPERNDHMTAFVSNLAYDVDEQKLTNIFSKVRPLSFSY